MSFAARDENPAGLFEDLGLSVRKNTGNVSLRCPLPGHKDLKASFSLKVDTGEFFCHGCDRKGGPETLARLMLEDDREACRVLIDRGYVVSDELAVSVGPAELRQMRGARKSVPARRLTHYEYPDLDGEIRFRVVRREPGRGGATKSFHQEHFDQDSGGWRNGRGGAEPIPFQLPALTRAVTAGQHVYIAEGEKDVLALEAAGVAATTNPGGASSWPAGWGERYFRGASVTVVVDRDDAGKSWARSVREDLGSVVREIRFVQAAEGKDASDHLAAGHSVDTFEASDLEAASVQWCGVVPLDEPPIPPMPLGDLPDVLREHVTEVARSYQVSTDLVLLADLAQIATVTQGLAVLQVRPDWREELSLYCIGVATSGERKSAVMEEASRPIRDFEIEVQQQQALSIETARALRDVSTKRVDVLKKKAAGAIGEARKTAEVELMAALHEQSTLAAPVEYRLLADDATPQALARLLADHGRIGLLGAEGGIFETLAGRYEQGIPNIDVVLKAYGGETCRVDRRGNDPLIIPRPLLSMGLLVQPDVIETAARNRAFVGRGLISRLLLARPESIVGYRDLEDAPVSDRARINWLRALRGLAAMGCPDDGGGGFVHFVQASPRYEMGISSSSETRSELDRFRSEVEHELRPQIGRYESIASTASKAPGLAARIAANLHLLESGSQASQSEIPAALMRAGCDIARASLEHHLRLFGALAEDVALRHARVVRAWGSERPDTWLSQVEILRSVRHRARAPHSSGDLAAALSLLEEHGYARSEETTARNAQNSGRPPSPKWMFRPNEGGS